MFLQPQTPSPVDVTLNDCTVEGGVNAAVSISVNKFGLPPGGHVTFNRLQTRDTLDVAILAEDKPASLKLNIVNATISNVSANCPAPIWLEGRNALCAGIKLQNVTVHDSLHRSVINMKMGAVQDVTGDLHVVNPAGCMPTNITGTGNTLKVTCTKTDDVIAPFQPLVAFAPEDWHMVGGNWSHVGAVQSGEARASSTSEIDSKLCVYKNTAFSTFDATFAFSLEAAESTTAAFLFGVQGPESYYVLDFPADGQQRRAENLWVTISRVNSSRTGSGSFRETLAMERVHGLTSAASAWHSVRIKLTSNGDVFVWVGDKVGHLRPIRQFGVREHGDAGLGVRPGLFGIATYFEQTPVFGSLAITGESHSAANEVAWPATASVAYRTLKEAAVWGMQLSSLVRAGNGDLVGLSNNGKALGVTGVNSLIRSTDRGRTFVKDNLTLPWPNYLYYGASLLATATHIEAYFLGPIGTTSKDQVIRAHDQPFTLGRAASKDAAGKVWGPVEVLETNTSFAAFETEANIRIDSLAQCNLVRLKDGTLLISATAQ